MEDRSNHPDIEGQLKKARSRSRGAHGGSAASGGIEYQARCAAWYAVQILAETIVPPRWDLPVTAHLTEIRCETGEPVDDILLSTAQGGYIFLQAKHYLDLSKSPNSDLADALSQCVQQYLQYEDSGDALGTNPWKRPLDSSRDRLIIVTSDKARASVREDLRDVLMRTHTLALGQPIVAAAVNRHQRNALAILLQHVRSAWENECGISPTDEQLKKFFVLLYVDKLDVDAGQRDEERAVERLQSIILAHPTQGTLAWNHLRIHCHQFMTDRSGTDLHGLQERLSHQQISLRGSPGFRADIEELHKLTGANLAFWQEHTAIRTGTQAISIRRNCIAELIQHATTTSFAVIGEPGAGKTGLLVEAAHSLADSGHDVVFLTADDLISTNIAGSLGISRLAHPLDAVLDNWPGITRGVLFIDALDAARSGPQTRHLMRLLQPVLQPESRWNVVASIRLFDLAHSPTLQQLFLGRLKDGMAETHSPAFENIRHMLVAPLTDQELQQVLAQSSELAALVASASPELRELMRNPFNLNIAGTLLSQGVTRTQLAVVGTQLELLDRYWAVRVLNPDADAGTSGSTRERVISTICEQFLTSRKLSVAYSILVKLLRGGEDERALEVLLQQHILLRRQWPIEGLTEKQVRRQDKNNRAHRTAEEIIGGAALAFDHLILFDYAISRLILRSLSSAALADHLAQERDLILTLAPSLTLHLHYLWTCSTPDTNALHTAFWGAVQQIMARPEIPWVTKIHGPTLAAKLATDITDLELLLVALSQTATGGESNRGAAEDTYRHVVDALPVSDRSLVGREAGPWCTLAERVATSSLLLRLQTALPTGALLAWLCEHPNQMTPTQCAAAGNAARHLLEFAEHQPTYHTWLLQRGLEAVCRTSASDPTATEKLLQAYLVPERVSTFGFQDLPVLARQLEWLIRAVPAFVSNLYRTAFTHTEMSQETTVIGSSQIFTFTSNRRQDFESGLHSLVQAFPDFLRQHPRYAVAVCLDLINHTVTEEHGVGVTIYTFRFMGREATLRPDKCDMWDHGIRSYDGPLLLLEALTRYLGELSGEPEQYALLNDLLGIIVERAEVAVIWKRLLQTGATQPETFGRAVAGLLEALPILTARETRYEAGEMLKVVYSVLDADTRERTERVLLNLADDVPSGHRDTIEKTRNQLLGCLPDQLQLEETQTLRDSLREQNALPKNVPSIVVRGGWTLDSSEEIDEMEGDATLAGAHDSALTGTRGDVIHGEANSTLREVDAPVAEFVQEHQRSAPSRSDLDAIWPALQALYAELENVKQTSADIYGQAEGWSHLIDACGQVAHLPDLDHTLEDIDEMTIFIRNVLLAGSEYPNPRPNPQRDAQLTDTDSLSWTSTDLRVPAAAGLIILAQHVGQLDGTVRETLQRLANDSVAVVRWQITTHLLALQHSDPDLMWALTEQFVSREATAPVLHALVTHGLGRLAGPYAERALPLVERIYDRTTALEAMAHVRAGCMDIFVGQTLWRDDARSALRVQTMVDDPLQRRAEIEHTIHALRHRLAYGLPLEERTGMPGNQADSEAALEDLVRLRAHDLFVAIIQSVARHANMLRTEHEGVPWNEWPEYHRKQMSILGNLLHTASTEFYFASGAFTREEEERGHQAGGNAVRLSEGQRRRFYTDMHDVFIQFADIGEASIAHNVLQTLASYVEVNPEEVLRDIGRVIAAAKVAGYHYESLAVDLLVGVVERYLAEYRGLFQQGDEYRTLLLDILDGFVAAGWPSARRLVYQLDTIYR